MPRKALLTPPEPFDPRTSRFTRCRTRRSFTTGTDHPKVFRSPRRRVRRPFVAPNRSARRLPDSHGAGSEDPLPRRVFPPEGFATPTAPGPKALYRARPRHPKALRSPRRRTRRSFVVSGRSARRLPNPHGAGPEGPLPCGPLHPKASRSPRRRTRRSFAAPGRSARRLPNPHGAKPEGPLPCRTSPPEGFPIHTMPGPKTHYRADTSVRPRRLPGKRKKVPIGNFLWIKLPIPVDNLVNPESALLASARAIKGDHREAKPMASNAARQPPRSSRLEAGAADLGLRESPPRP